MNEKHHKIAPSSIGAMIPGRCQGRANMEDGLPDLEDDRGEFGTTFHGEIKKALDNFRETGEFGAEKIKDHEIRFCVERSLWWLKSKGILDKDFDTEVRLEVHDENGRLLTFGTADLAKAQNNEVIVVDWKSYKTEIDDVMATMQLECYIPGACEKYGKTKGKGWAYFPYLDLEYYYEATLEKARKEIEHVVRGCENPNAPLKAGHWCKTCKAKLICPETKRHAEALAKELAVTHPNGSKAELERRFKAQLERYVEAGNVAKVAEIGELVYLLEPAVNAWRTVAKELMENGYTDNFANWELKERQGKRHARLLDVYHKVSPVIPDDQFADCADIKWGELERHYTENVRLEALKHGHKIPKTKAKKMLDEVLEPVVERTTRKELWRKK